MERLNIPKIYIRASKMQKSKRKTYKFRLLLFTQLA